MDKYSISYQKEKRKNYILLIIVNLLLLSTACFIGGSFMDKGQEVKSFHLFGPGDSTLGKIENNTKNSVYEVSIKREMDNFSWEYVTLAISDANKNEMFYLSEELFYEYYSRSEIYNHTSASSKFVLPDPGTYFITLYSEKKHNADLGNLHVNIDKLPGTSLPFDIAAYAFIILSALITYIYRSDIFNV